MTAACTYCGQDVTRYDPAYVEETEDGQRVPAGRFPNYACLQSYVEEQNLVSGACCQWSPD